jgi:hypothetical protein
MPMLAAAGVTLAFTGLVTSFIVTAIGLVLAITGFVGWFREVLPREHRETVKIATPVEELAPVRIPRIYASASRTIAPDCRSKFTRIPRVSKVASLVDL